MKKTLTCTQPSSISAVPYTQKLSVQLPDCTTGKKLIFSKRDLKCCSCAAIQWASITGAVEASPQKTAPVLHRLTTTGWWHTYTNLPHPTLRTSALSLSSSFTYAFNCLNLPVSLSPLSAILPCFREAKSKRIRTKVLRSYMFFYWWDEKNSLGSFSLTRHSLPKDRLHPRSPNAAAQSTIT